MGVDGHLIRQWLCLLSFFHITSSPSSSCLFNKRWLFKPAVKPRQIHLLKQATTMCWLQGLTVDFAVHHNLSKSGSSRPTFFYGGFVHTGNVHLCLCLRCICTQWLRTPWLTSAASDSFSEPNMTRALKMDEEAVESHIRLILLTDETFWSHFEDPVKSLPWRNGQQLRTRAYV